MDAMALFSDDDEGVPFVYDMPSMLPQKLSDIHAEALELVREQFVARDEVSLQFSEAETDRHIRNRINSLIEKIDHGPMGVSKDIINRLLPYFTTAVKKGIPQFIHYHLDRLLGEIPDAIEAKMHRQPRSNYGEVVISYQREGLPMKLFIEVERRTGNPWTDADGVQYAIVGEDDYDDRASWVCD
jgi:hypothetical protein